VVDLTVRLTSPCPVDAILEVLRGAAREGPLSGTEHRLDQDKGWGGSHSTVQEGSQGHTHTRAIWWHAVGITGAHTLHSAHS
jgi:hypothetical protein